MKRTPDPALSKALASRIALLQLSSVALPVGGFSYSQGLESAIEQGVLGSHDQIEGWIADVLEYVIGRYEAPVWWQLYLASSRARPESFDTWNEEFLATRETAELRAETLQMGHSMAQLLRGLDAPVPVTSSPLTWPAAHAWTSALWEIEPADALAGYLFAWAENQVMAAIKCFALGQLTGQGMLLELRAAVARVVETAPDWDEERLSSQAPAFAIISAQHEQQYSRLFRS